MRKLFKWLYFIIHLFIEICIVRKRILIVIDQYGRLGNRLFLFAQLMEFSEKTGREVWMPGFYDYRHYFVRFSKNYSLKFPNSFSISSPFFDADHFQFSQSLPKIIKLFKLSKLFEVCSFYNVSDGDPFKKITNSSKSCILFSGFIFHDFFLEIKKSRKQIVKYFTPSIKFLENINKPLRKLRSNTDIVVGVLIRQTDYREWNGGKYFFSSEEYIKILSNFNTKNSDKKIGYFIATDEDQNINLFKNLNCCVRVGYPLENMYTLSKCDYLIGPPSSYIGWSAFYGNIPLFSITSLDVTPNFNKIF